MTTYLSADPKPEPVEVGRRFWNNDLRVVEVTELACAANPWPDTDATQTWHKTSAGRFDTMSGKMREYGRLARYCDGYDAELYQPGVRFADIKTP
jgi:hypothetical protein